MDYKKAWNLFKDCLKDLINIAEKHNRESNNDLSFIELSTLNGVKAVINSIEEDLKE